MIRKAGIAAGINAQLHTHKRYSVPVIRAAGAVMISRAVEGERRLLMNELRTYKNRKDYFFKAFPAAPVARLRCR